MLKVLVVDDEPMERKGIMLGVDWASMDCIIVGEAANGEEGLAAAMRYDPNLIITDVRMPKMDGLEMLKALRETGNQAHVILLTAYSDFEYARMALQHNADDYLVKPFDNQDLLAAIRKIHEKENRWGTPVLQNLPSLAKKNQSKYVLEAINYIAEHYRESGLNISIIAQHLGLSEGHLSHTFKKETSYTVVNYLTMYRMHAAMEELKDCRNKVYEVSERVGYRDVTYFSSQFKKYTGMTPSEYQSKCK